MKEIIFIRRATPQIGGIQSQIFRLAKQFYERKIFQPVLITESTDCGIAELFKNEGFEVLAVLMGKKQIFSAAKKILKMLENRNAALIQTHMFHESLIARLVRKKRPDLRHVLRGQTYIDGVFNPEWKKRIYHTIDGKTSRWVDRYVTNGKYMADEIINRSSVEPGRVRVLINGRDRIGLPDGPADFADKPLENTIAMVAAFRPEKGHDCLIKALAILKKKNIIINVRLIGGDAREKTGSKITGQIQDMAARYRVLEQIEFYGLTKDVYGAMKGISTVVLPANGCEGVPNCILEAMSLRKLIVASEMNGVGELIEDNLSGFLHQPKDYRRFAEILERIFTTPAKQFEGIRDCAMQRWQEKFTLDIMIDNFIKIYRELKLVDADKNE